MNTTSISPKKIKQARTAIIIASIAIPVLVAVLFKVQIPGLDLGFLPPIYATINGITAVLLVGALLAIKNQNRKLHENLIKMCMVLSLIFLGCYVAYHMASVSTLYGDSDHSGKVSEIEKAAVAGSAIFYYILLLTHILLSVIIVPLVLFSYLFAWEGNYVRHKKWTRFTWPIWFYVAVSGVIVYLMISPYYN